MPHISVMIPTYNRAQLVKNTIMSVLQQQGFSDFSITVIDDHSTDGSAAVIADYIKDLPQVKLVVNPKNLGLTKNWNRCIELAQGPLVQIVQSDDLIDSHYLATVSAIFDTYPTVGMVASSCRYIDGAGNVIDPGQTRPSALLKAGDEAVMHLLQNGFPHVSGIVVRRECYQQVGVIDETIWQGPDMEMDTRIARAYDYYYIGEPCTSFRRHGTNQGVLNYLRTDFLTVDYKKRYLSWSRLSPAKLGQMGITSLEGHVQKMTSSSALTGAIALVGYGRAELSRKYVYEALKRDTSTWKRKQFWKAIALNLVPPFGHWVMAKRMGITPEDRAKARQIEKSLLALKT